MDARQWPVREERLHCTHIIVSLLKAWKVTMVGIECDDAALYLYCHSKFKNVHTRNCSLKNIFFKILQARWQTGL